MNTGDDKNTKETIMIIAGEVSGDLIGAPLISELKKLDPDLSFCGIGGDRMMDAGMEVIYHINRLAFLGFTEIVKHIPFIKKVQRNLVEVAVNRKIKKIVLIDYPGFNLSIAKKIKKKGIKIIYYVSPQIWAWGQNRIKKIKNIVDKMLVVFPFEEKLYNDNDVNVEFVGHPLSERIEKYKFTNREGLFEKFKLDKSKDILLLMPGSRKNEVEKLFPQMIKAANRLAASFNLQIVIAGSPNIDKSIFSKLGDSTQFTVISNHLYDLMKYARFGIIKSGTSTLEAAYFALPMVIVYRTSTLTYLIGRRLIKVDKIGMANIILDDSIVPELIQKNVSEEKIFEAGSKILNDEAYYNSIKTKLSEVKNKLGKPGASAKTAKLIYEMTNGC